MAARYSVEVDGKVAVVSGAEQDVGFHLALSLAQHGCKLVLVGRTADLESVPRRIVDDLDEAVGIDGGRRVQFSDIKVVEFDATAGEAKADAAVEEGIHAFGSVDILLHSGLYQAKPTPPLELAEEEWDKTMSQNVKGAWLLSKAVSKRMQQQGKGGSIIFVTSIAGIDRSFFPGVSAFGTSIAAIHHLTQALAMELGKYQIRVNAIARGLLESDRGINPAGTPAEDVVPLKRWLHVSQDLPALVLLYAGDFNKYLTANISIVDGGLSIVRPRMKAAL